MGTKVRYILYHSSYQRGISCPISFCPVHLGTSPNFASLLFTMASEFNTEAFTLLGVGVFVVAIRTASRLSIAGFKGLWLDDYLMLFATVGQTAISFACTRTNSF